MGRISRAFKTLGILYGMGDLYVVRFWRNVLYVIMMKEWVGHALGGCHISMLY